ncbi:MAG: hypothetical protein K0M45_07260 [Candidatus Paracaedibacteraceae bacterium]|nr:hypothetical protein [Candidatus Paracaedibacteraceae bacterium]
MHKNIELSSIKKARFFLLFLTFLSGAIGNEEQNILTGKSLAYNLEEKHRGNGRSDLSTLLSTFNTLNATEPITKVEFDKKFKAHLNEIGTISTTYSLPYDSLKQIQPRLWRKKWAKNASTFLNQYSIKVSAATFSAALQDDPLATDIFDYYDICLEFDPTANTGLAENYFLPKAYCLEAVPIQGTLPVTIQPEDWCPQTTTTQGNSTYTESMQFTLSGNIGGGYPPSATAGVGPTYTIGHQYSRVINNIDIIATMPHTTFAKWEIRHNNLSLRPPLKGYQPEGTTRHSLRWIWKINHQAAIDYSLYQSEQEEGPLYFSFNIKFYTNVVPMRAHRSQRQRKAKETGYLPLWEHTIKLEVPTSPKLNKGRAIVDKKHPILAPTSHA